MARKILLADDSVTAQNMGRKILTDAGYEVVTVNNGSAALKKILELRPDLIVLDVYMPGYSGLEVCQRIKENKETSRIPILLTVGKLEPFKPEEARRAKADAFVVKPFEASELLAALTRLEDKIVPQPEPYKQGRFAKAIAAVEPEGAAESDESWKARLRIPTGPAKAGAPEPPEVEYAATQGKESRDFGPDAARKAKTAAHESTFASAKTFERPMPAGLPADITPEEIAAITAAAEQLKSGSAPVAPPETEMAARAAAPEFAVAAEEPGPVTFASAPEEQAPGATPGLSPVDPVALSGTQLQNPSAEVPSDGTNAPQSTSVAAESREESIPAPESAVPQAVATQKADSTSTDVVPVEATGAPETSAVPPTLEPAASAPAPAPRPPDDEVMAALQSLMPVGGSTSEIASNPVARNDEMPAALAAIVAEVDSAVLKAHAAGPRWIAEEVALAPDESTLSLEREMEQAYAAAATNDSLRASSAALVDESRSAAASVAVAEPPSPEAVATPQPAVVEPEVTEAPAVYAMAAAAGDAGAVVMGTTAPIPEIAAAQIETAPTHQPSEPAGVIDSGAAGADASVAEEAQAVHASAPASIDQDIAGGAEDMAANWKNIRDSIATGGAAKPAPAKEKEEARAVEPESSNAEASAPAGVAATASASDPRAIASIVDSVLAELRPKIVEEIARKLADPKKG